MVAFGRPLERATQPVPIPTDAAAVVRIGSSGVCHSDLHVWEGSFDLGGGRALDFKPNLTLPHTLGHEIAGEVIDVGPAARLVSVGERCVVYPWIGCGRCSRCESSEEHLCAAPRSLGTRTNGGFADHVLVPHERYLVPYGGVREEFACTLPCSGLTSYAALRKAAPFSDRDPLLVIGAGGVGFSAIRLAATLHGVHPWVAEIDRKKWDAARAAGAREMIDPREEGTAKRVLAATGGFAAVVDFVGASETASFGMSVLRKGGRLVLVGLFGGALTLSLPLLPLRAISLIGSFVGSLAEFRELMDLARAGKLKEIPVEVRPMTEAQKTLDDLKGGRVLGRVVLKPTAAIS